MPRWLLGLKAEGRSPWDGTEPRCSHSAQRGPSAGMQQKWSSCYALTWAHGASRALCRGEGKLVAMAQSHSTALTNSAGQAAPPQAETPACSSQGTQHKALQGSSLVLTCTTLPTSNIKTLHRKKYLQIVQNYPAAFSNAIQVLLTRPVTLLLTAPVSNMQSWECSLAHPHLHGLGMMHRGTQGSL